MSDVRLFAAWFAEQAGEPFAPEAVTEYDVQAWRDGMVEARKPDTINRRLAALILLPKQTKYLIIVL